MLVCWSLKIKSIVVVFLFYWVKKFSEYWSKRSSTFVSCQNCQRVMDERDSLFLTDVYSFISRSKLPVCLFVPLGHFRSGSPFWLFKLETNKRSLLAHIISFTCSDCMRKAHMSFPSAHMSVLLWLADDSIIRPVTFWVVGDFDQPSGRQLLYDAIRHMVGQSCLCHPIVHKTLYSLQNLVAKMKGIVHPKMETTKKNSTNKKMLSSEKRMKNEECL